MGVLIAEGFDAAWCTPTRPASPRRPDLRLDLPALHRARGHARVLRQLKLHLLCSGEDDFVEERGFFGVVATWDWERVEMGRHGWGPPDPLIASGESLRRRSFGSAFGVAS